MQKSILNQGTITIFSHDSYIPIWIESFLIDRKVQNLSPGSLVFYQKKLAKFLTFCDLKLITQITQLTPTIIREYLMYLSDNGHNTGGIHACFRALKTFLRWWEDEIEPDVWKNPIHKVKAPKLQVLLLEPVRLDSVKRMIDACDKHSINGLRDRAVILFLLDTGIRASELCSLDLEDLDRTMTSAVIRKGKGGKPRAVFLGKKTRRAVRAYLKKRVDQSSAIWVGKYGERLSYWGLRQIIRRRANDAGISSPGIHSDGRLHYSL